MSAEYVSRVVWDWRKGTRSAPAACGRSALAVRVAVGAAVGAVLYWRLHRAWLAWVVWGITALLLVSGLLLPALYARIERFFLKLGHVAGAVLNWVFFVPVYYAVFGTGRLVLAVWRKDPMRRQFPTTLPTYWEDHPADTDPGRYRRQH